MTMTRQEAIDSIIADSLQLAGEFCVSGAEANAASEATRDALRALGVTDAEMDA